MLESETLAVFTSSLDQRSFRSSFDAEPRCCQIEHGGNWFLMTIFVGESTLPSCWWMYLMMFFLNKQFSWSTIFAKLYLWVRHFPVLGQEGWDVVNQVTHHIAWLCRFCRKVSESFQMKSRRWPPEQMTWKWLNPTWRARKAPCTAEDSVVVWCRCCVVQRSWEGLCALHRTLEPSTTAEEQWSQWKRRQLPRFATSNSCKFWEAELLRFKRFCSSSISVSHSLFICVQVSHGDVHVVRITMSFDHFWPVRHCKMERETRWWFQIFFIFTPIWGRFPYWRSYFSDGLVQPPTRKISTRRYREDFHWRSQGAPLAGEELE